MKRWEPIFWPLLSVAAVLTAWHLAVVWTNTHIFPSPLAVLSGVVELAHRGLLWKYIADSLFRVGTGYVAALLLAIPLGIILGYYSKAADTVNPVIQVLRPISPLAWIPLTVIWFGVGNSSAAFLIF